MFMENVLKMSPKIVNRIWVKSRTCVCVLESTEKEKVNYISFTTGKLQIKENQHTNITGVK